MLGIAFFGKVELQNVWYSNVLSIQAPILVMSSTLIPIVCVSNISPWAYSELEYALQFYLIVRRCFVVMFKMFRFSVLQFQDQLDLKTLQFQNHKLSLRLTQRMQIEEDLRSRIDQLEKRQTQDDAVINVIHRYSEDLNTDFCLSSIKMSDIQMVVQFLDHHWSGIQTVV